MGYAGPVLAVPARLLPDHVANFELGTEPILWGEQAATGKPGIKEVVDMVASASAASEVALAAPSVEVSGQSYAVFMGM
jgi:hypothetical protein